MKNSSHVQVCSIFKDVFNFYKGGGPSNSSLQKNLLVKTTTTSFSSLKLTVATGNRKNLFILYCITLRQYNLSSFAFSGTQVSENVLSNEYQKNALKKVRYRYAIRLDTHMYLTFLTNHYRSIITMVNKYVMFVKMQEMRLHECIS